MSRARIVVIGIGALLILFGLLLQFRPDLAAGLLAPLLQPGTAPILLGAALVLSSLFEGRYRRVADTPAPQGPGWEKTGETFRDEESGKWVQVWFHAESGERRYVPSERPG
jgi:hypothetical protein